MERTIKRGDMFYADLAQGLGSEQSGSRPVVIIQNDVGNAHSPTVIAAVITSSSRRRKMPTHCHLRAQKGLRWDSTVLLEQIRTVDKGRLKEYIGTLDDEAMGRIDNSLAVSVGLAR